MEIGTYPGAAGHPAEIVSLQKLRGQLADAGTGRFDAVHAALDAGITFIDTAPVYGFGRSEEVVGRAIRDRREKVVLAIKCRLWWPDATGAPFFDQMGHTVRRSLDPRTIRVEVEASLRRLGTDRIDVLRHSMLDRAIEADVLPYCRAHGIATLVYSPLEQGLLTGAYGLDRTLSPEEARVRIRWFAPANRGKVLAMLAGWADLTAAHRCTLAQLVIAWTLAQPGVTCALVGARRAANARENAGAGRGPRRVYNPPVPPGTRGLRCAGSCPRKPTSCGSSTAPPPTSSVGRNSSATSSTTRRT